MKAFAVLPIVLSCVNTAAAWSKSNHWTTSLITGWGDPVTSTVEVTPTGAVSATSTATSTTSLVWVGADYTFEVTVYDLFYPATAEVCRSKCPTSSTTSNDITTTYWVPVQISNPTSCTKTSFDYTTVSTIRLPPTLQISDAAQQATQSVEALFVTTYVSTLSTNKGGQEVTTTVCDVYLRSDAVSGVSVDLFQSSILNECMDPRDYYCQQYSEAISLASLASTTTSPHATCEPSGQTYPPTAIAGAATGAATTGAASPTKSSGAGGLRVSPTEFGVSLAVSGFAALLVSFY